MTDRIFQQYAQGYGSTPCQVVCQIDGTTVFSGEVATFDQPLPSLPNVEMTVNTVAWTWQAPADFTGSKQISIAVTGSDLLLAQTFANDPDGADANVFSPFFSTVIDGVEYLDPFTDEAINGVTQSGPYRQETPGQWWWHIPAGSTFTAALNILPPPPPPAP